MIIGRAAITVFVFLAFAAGPWPRNGQESGTTRHAGERRVPFFSRDGAVFVRARVNGNRATLLIDTGAALTTFSSKLVPTRDTDPRITINMAKGSVLAFRLPVGFTLGESKVSEEHCSFRQDAIVGDFQFGVADGVIGLDVLSSFKSVTFDFGNSLLILGEK